jgi:hypothetical protein
MASTSEIVESYKIFLEVKYPGNFENFCNRLKNHPESAKAEAVLFSVLRPVFCEVKIAEDISTGGVDFLCISDRSKFIIEVTCLETDSVAKQSGLKNEIPENGSPGWFSLITHKLRTKASSKAGQVSAVTIPRLLAITTEHFSGDILLGPRAAEFLLTSDTKIEVPIGKPIDEIGMVTDLKDSVFFRLRNGSLESCRKSISAIFLVHILADKCSILGVLHPDPEYDFPIKLFPNVPFIRTKKWPPENNQIETEWVIYSPPRAEFYYRPITFKEEELKRI